MSAVLLLGGSSRFSPRSISGCKIWLDALSPSTIAYGSGVRISEWRDRSGYGNHASESTGSLQPEYADGAINGHGAVMFYPAGTYTRMRVSDNPTLDYTTCTLVAVVRQHTALGITQTVGGKFSANIPANEKEHRIQVNSVQKLNFERSSNGTTSSSAVLNSPLVVVNTNYIVEGYYNGSTAGVSLITDSTDDTATAGPFASIFNRSSPYIIGGRDAGAEPFAGYIGEVIFYTKSLDATERSLLINYLRTKWF